MIIDGRGRLVWFRQLTPPVVAANLADPALCGSRRVLTWWQGPVTPSAFGLGEGVIADSSYRTIATVQAGNGYEMDIHEFELTPGGRCAASPIYSPVLVHLPGTPAGRALAAARLDRPGGGHRAPGSSSGSGTRSATSRSSDSYATPANSASYDAFHINSIQPLRARAGVLISARDTSAVYEVGRAERADHAGRWAARPATSGSGRGARFYFQHDARMLPRRPDQPVRRRGRAAAEGPATRAG